MTRPRQLAALVAAVLLSFVLWLLLRDQPEPTPQPSLVGTETAAPPAPEPAAARQPSAPVVERETSPTPTSTRATPPPPATPALSGIVKEINSVALPDILVELLDADGVTVQSTKTDEAGKFAFDSVPIEAKTIATRPAPTGLPRLGHGMPRSRGSGPGGPSNTLHIWRPPSGTITGVVVDDRGTPIAGANVSTDRPYVPLGADNWTVLEGEEPRMSVSAKTAADGRFELPFCLHGQHLLRANSGERSGSVKVDAAAAGVVIRLGTHLGGAVVLAGQLTDRVTGAPIAGARVSVSRLRRYEHGSSGVGVARVETDAQGRYEVQGLEAGLYGLRTMPDGYAPTEAEGEFADGHHVLDLTLLPARQLRVKVVLPDGRPVKDAKVRVRDADGGTVQVPFLRDMLADEMRTDADGIAMLRRLPAAPLTLLAVRGDFVPAGLRQLDLRGDAPQEVLITMPNALTRFARRHYFLLMGADGKPAEIEGTVVARSFDGDSLLSHVEGSWRDGKFVFGNDRDDRDSPTIAVGAIAGACRVEITAPGYQLVTLTLQPDAKSPSTVTLRH